jgi:mucin-19
VPVLNKIKRILEKHFFVSAILIVASVFISSCSKSSSPSSTSGGTPVPTTTSTSTNTGISPPDISYTYPEYYTVGTAINSLTPGNTGTSVPAGNYGGTKIIADNFFNPEGLVFDQMGNLFVTEAGDDKIKEITPAGVVSTFITTDSLDYLPSLGYPLGGPEGITIDQSGNLYNCNSNTSLIKKTTPGGLVSTFAGNYPASNPFVNGTGTTASFRGPMGIAIDQAGNFFVADQGNHAIRKITPDGLVSTFATGLFYPTAVAFDPSGYLFASDMASSTISKISPGGVVSNFEVTGITGSIGRAWGMVFDQSGNLYYSGDAGPFIRKINPSGVAIDSLPIDGSFQSITIDKSGNLYAGYTNEVVEIFNTGYSITPHLPDGLKFDNTTGRISGNPSVSSPSTIYTITAHTASGATSTTTITFSVK